MLISIDPVALAVGPLAVRWFGLLALLGLAIALGLSLRVLEPERGVRALALDALAWGLPSGLIAAWLVHVVGYWDYYLTNPAQLWGFGLDGLSLWGGLVGGGLVACARLGRGGDAWRTRRMLDVVVPYAALGIAIGRAGEFLDGQGQGLPSGLPWATQYANRLAASPDLGVPRHPVQVYDGLVALALCGLLLLLPRAAPAGTRLAVCLVLYGAARVGLGAVRLDPAVVFGLQLEQVLALGCVVAGLVLGLRLLVAGPARRRSEVAEGTLTPRTPAAEDSVAA